MWSSPSKTLRSVLITGAVLVVCAEIAVAAAAFLVPALFQRRADFDRAIDRVDPQAFARFATSVRPPQIWDTVPGSTVDAKTCLGQPVKATYDRLGARNYPGYDAARANVLLIGDSFTHGDEAGDESTISAHLFKQAGIVSANLGVGGYSPVQAVLKVKRARQAFPRAEAVVLGVMHENVRRNVSGSVAIFTNDASSLFGVRPYAAGGQIHEVPDAALKDLEAFKTHMRGVIHNDFWALPEARFPYILSLYRLAASDNFQLRNKSRINALMGRQYSADFAHPVLAAGLSTAVSDFLNWTTREKLQGLVVFIPQNSRDLSSPRAWLTQFEAAHGKSPNIVISPMENVDWKRYNLKADGDCHPSDYGYAAIASAYARSLAALPSKPSR